ncbi:hypothetical protein QM075_17495 [Klebsiella pneumoniae]|uniref:hypothetical protein n=1 Tax=Klebsiella pneumoniae TaxID=573 RepID=UPI00294914AF|nr:hypothetical protein [Klebsiella pneumoniae]MDV5299763.1 hypothetical protein [Klebsiella pneumoniae]
MSRPHRLQILRRSVIPIDALFADARHAQEDKFYEKHGKHSDTSRSDSSTQSICVHFLPEIWMRREKWEEQAQQLQNLLTSQVIGAATAHSLLLVGPAGISDHMIVSAALRRLEHGGFSWSPSLETTLAKQSLGKCYAVK